MNTNKNYGFSIVEVVIAVVVIGIIGGLGYVAYNNFTDKSQNSQSNASDKTAQTDQAKLQKEMDNRLKAAKQTPKPAVESKTDLDKGIEALNDRSKFDTSKEAEQMKQMASTFLN